MPKSVVVFGRTIPVKYLSSKDIIKLYPNPNGAPSGLWDSTTRTIYINSDLPRPEQKYTLYHELGHACNTFTGMELILAPEIQEIMVQSYATLIEDILKQSAKLK